MCRRLNCIIVALLLFTLAAQPAAAQNKGAGPKEKSLKSERRIRRELRREAIEKRRKERAERKAVKKHHKRLQTKKVRKRMKSSRKYANRYNDHKREFFLTRWLKKKKKV